MKTFKEKVAVITGAGSGMGRYLAVLLAKDGADVCICDVNQETLDETAEMLRQYNVSVSSHLLAVSDKESIESLPQKVIDHHGKIDLVFNNHKIHKVINLAAQAGVRYSIENPSAYIKSNIVGFTNILENYNN